MILTLRRLSVFDRDIYLFDTFDGMTAPTDVDQSLDGDSAKRLLEQASDRHNAWIWAKSGLDQVRSLLESMGFSTTRLHYVRGPVETALPGDARSRIALLRLHTDWYESTRHELPHLFPRLSRGGLIIIDDYGHRQGARKAVDEFLRSQSSACSAAELTTREG